MFKKFLTGLVCSVAIGSANATVIGVFTEGSINNALSNIQHVADSGLLTPADGPDTVININSNAAFNAMSVNDLISTYDTLVMPWEVRTNANFDWATRLLPYLNGGGSILWENPNDLGELAASGLGLTTGNIYSASGESQISLTSPFGDAGAQGHFHIHYSITDAADWDVWSVDIFGGVHGVNQEFANGGRMVLGVSDNLYHPDFTGAGVEDHFQLAVNQLNWLNTGNIAGRPSTSIPEPTSLAILGTGLLLLGASRRRKV